MVYAREKKVDKDAICPINVMSQKFNHLQHLPDKSLIANKRQEVGINCLNLIKS